MKKTTPERFRRSEIVILLARYDGLRLRLMLSVKLFKLPADDQRRTVLHELLHLSVCEGALKERRAKERALRVDYPSPGPTIWIDKPRRQDKNNYRNHRYTLAFSLFLFPDEILAERTLRDDYPGELTGRLRQHIDMHEQDLANGAHDKAHSQLLKYWVLFEWMRAEMMVRLAPEGDERTQLQAIAERYDAMLRDVASEEEAPADPRA